MVMLAVISVISHFSSPKLDQNIAISKGSHGVHRSPSTHPIEELGAPETPASRAAAPEVRGEAAGVRGGGAGEGGRNGRGAKGATAQRGDGWGSRGAGQC